MTDTPSFREKTYLLNNDEAQEMKNAINLARSYLQCPAIGEAAKKDALSSLYTAKQIFNRKDRIEGSQL